MRLVKYKEWMSRLNAVILVVLPFVVVAFHCLGGPDVDDECTLQLMIGHHNVVRGVQLEPGEQLGQFCHQRNVVNHRNFMSRLSFPSYEEYRLRLLGTSHHRSGSISNPEAGRAGGAPENKQHGVTKMQESLDLDLASCIFRKRLLHVFDNSSSEEAETWIETWKPEEDDVVWKYERQPAAFSLESPGRRLFTRNLAVLYSLCRLEGLESAIWRSSAERSTARPGRSATETEPNATGSGHSAANSRHHAAGSMATQVESTLHKTPANQWKLLSWEEYQLSVATEYLKTVRLALGVDLQSRQESRAVYISIFLFVTISFFVVITIVYVIIIYSAFVSSGTTTPEEDDVGAESYQLMSPYVKQRLKKLKKINKEFHREISILMVGQAADGMGKVKEVRAFGLLLLERKKFCNVCEVQTSLDCDVFASGLISCRNDHSRDLANFAIDLRSMCTYMRISGVLFGMHSGRIKVNTLRGLPSNMFLAGHIFETVSHIESSCQVDTIHISQQTYQHLIRTETYDIIESKDNQIVGKQRTFILCGHKYGEVDSYC